MPFIFANDVDDIVFADGFQVSKKVAFVLELVIHPASGCNTAGKVNSPDFPQTMKCGITLFRRKIIQSPLPADHESHDCWA